MKTKKRLLPTLALIAIPLTALALTSDPDGFNAGGASNVATGGSIAAGGDNTALLNSMSVGDNNWSSNGSVGMGSYNETNGVSFSIGYGNESLWYQSISIGAQNFTQGGAFPLVDIIIT